MRPLHVFDAVMHLAHRRATLAGVDPHPLSQDQLAAFAAVARTGSFTRAAAELHLSQPALSRRVANLEAQLGATLLVRGPKVEVTEAGRRVLAFTHAQRALEDELLGELRPDQAALRGLVRIAGSSSIVPALVRPALAPLVREHPHFQLEVQNLGPEELAAALAQGATDFGLSTEPSERAGLVSVPCGHEELVVIEGTVAGARGDVFLDATPADRTTDGFFAAQPARSRLRRWRRSFLHDEPGILLGVELGLGRAVKPRHTIPPTSSVRIDPRFTPVRKPVYLQYRAQRVYGRIHRLVAARLEQAVRAGLDPVRRR